MDVFARHKNSSLRSMKRREGVFSPKAQKRYVYKSFMDRKEVHCKIVYMFDSKLYTSNITDLVQQMLQ
jgi:predicted transcriptional regulator